MRDAPLLRLALRRLRSHPVESLLLFAAVLGGCALVSAVGVIAAVGREQATRATLSALPDARRVVRAQVRYEPAISSDSGGEAVAAAAIDRLGDLVQRPARVRVVLQLLKRAAAELGATVIVSSHDPDALEAADEVLPLELTANAGPAGT